MKSFSFLPTLMLLATLSTITTATFNLNTSGPDWDYLAKDLANTTSDTCKAAYSASISCDATLLGLVASMRPAFKPTSSDLDNTCTATCSASLESYVKGVKEACTAPGDKANESPGGSNWSDYILDPVELVGEIFQYRLAKSCRKQLNGTYCYGSTLSSASTFSCDDECTASFYQTAHNYSASGWIFNYYLLVSQSSWWEEEFAKGWARLKKCRKAVNNGSSTSAASSTSTSTSTISMTPSTATAISTVSAISATTTSVANGVTSPSVSSTSASASTATNAGTSLRASTLGGIMFLSTIYAQFSS